MKAIRNVLALTALCVVASAQQNSNSAAEQRYFNLEDSVQNRVDLSDAELAVLASDDLMGKELHQTSPIPKLTQEGIQATVVHLCNSGERDIVAIGNGAAFIDANVGPFWIIRDLPAGPVVVLSETSTGLTIETKQSNKCLNVQAFAATAVATTTTDFSFNGEKYVATHQKSQKLAQ